jgi:hypothetical protein
MAQSDFSAYPTSPSIWMTSRRRFRAATWMSGIAAGNGGVVPTNSVSINNNLVANSINSVTYSGARLSVLFEPNDAWDVLVQQSYQNMNAQGVFYEQPYGPEGLSFNTLGEPQGVRALPPLSVTTFEPSYGKDKFESTSVTVNGKVGDIKLAYAGSYLVRNIEQQPATSAASTAKAPPRPPTTGHAWRRMPPRVKVA